MSSRSFSDLRPVARPRLYEQVAEQITAWIDENSLKPGDRLLPERELATRLNVSRATVSQALVALEVIGVVAVRHGDGTVVADPSGSTKIVDALREHANRLPEIIDARDALETKIAGLAAVRRTGEDLTRIGEALRIMETDIDEGGRGVRGDELFHAAVTTAAHSSLLGKMMAEMSDLIRESRIESLSQQGRPRASLAAHHQIFDAISEGDPHLASTTMHAHVQVVSDIAMLRG